MSKYILLFLLSCNLCFADTLVMTGNVICQGNIIVTSDHYSFFICNAQRNFVGGHIFNITPCLYYGTCIVGINEKL